MFDYFKNQKFFSTTGALIIGSFVVALLFSGLLLLVLPESKEIRTDKLIIPPTPKNVIFWGNTVSIWLTLVFISCPFVFWKSNLENALFLVCWIPLFMFFSWGIPNAESYLKLYVPVVALMGIGLSLILCLVGIGSILFRIKKKEPKGKLLVLTSVASIPFILSLAGLLF